MRGARFIAAAVVLLALLATAMPASAVTLPVPCTPTADPGSGSDCALTTSADTLAPGAVPEGRRGVWEVVELLIRDGGDDGDADTQPNALFMHPGVFVP